MIKMEKFYHASGDVVEFPEIRMSTYTKDFSWGFYCTNNYEQARRWAVRGNETPIVNNYTFNEIPDLKILRFEVAEVLDER